MKKIDFVCDGCGQEIYGTPHKDYDENYRLQRGIRLCTECKYGFDEDE